MHPPAEGGYGISVKLPENIGKVVVGETYQHVSLRPIPTPAWLALDGPPNLDAAGQTDLLPPCDHFSVGTLRLGGVEITAEDTQFVCRGCKQCE